MDKKQLIIPVVTLVICSLAVVGVGYALTTSVDNTGNDVTPDGYEIILNDASGAVTTNLVFDSAKIDYTVDTKTGATNSKTYTIAAGQEIMFNDVDQDGASVVTLKSNNTGTTSTFAGTLVVTLTDGASKNLFDFFESITINIDGQDTVLATSNNGQTYTASGIAFDGDSPVVLKGVTKLWTNTTAPVYTGTFGISFVLTPAP